jgi:hypothetical protein
MADVLVASSKFAYTGMVSAAYLDGLSTDQLASSYRRALEGGNVFWVARAADAVVGMARAAEPREPDPPRKLELAMHYLLPGYFGSGAA